MSQAISYSEWRAALEAAETPADDDGRTAYEWRRHLRMGDLLCRQWVKEGEAKGWLKKGVRYEPRTGDGAMMRKFVWSLVKGKNGKGTK